MDRVGERSPKRLFIAGVTALAASAMLSLGAASPAHAGESKFCTAANLAAYGKAGYTCADSTARYLTGVYGQGSERVCAGSIGVATLCSNDPSNGIYVGFSGGELLNAGIYNPTAKSNTVYGYEWWVASPPESPPPPPSPPPAPPTNYRYMLGTSNGSGISMWGAIGGLTEMSKPSPMAAGDFSGDGKTDIVAVEPSGGSYRYMLGTSNGSGIGSWNQIMSGMGQPTQMRVADFTGDGKADIVAIEPSGGSYRYMLGTSNGSGVASWNQIMSGMGSAIMRLGDFTGDGKADIVAVEDAGGGSYRYMLGTSNGSGVASWNQIMSGMSSVAAVEVDKFTSDGKADIVAVEPSGGSYRYMLGTSNGSGVASWNQIMSGMGLPSPMRMGDMTGDGKADIVGVESAGGGSYRYMLGTSNGSGVASWNQILGGMGQAITMGVGDIGSDGKADIISVEQN